MKFDEDEPVPPAPTLDEGYWLAVCSLQFAVCSYKHGTRAREARHQTVTTDQVAAYLEQRQERTVNPVERDPETTYEWFY